MYARVIQATISPKRVAEFKGAVTDHNLPIIRSQPGFVDDVEMYAGNQFISLTFWETEEDAERFTREVLPPIATRSGPLVVTPLEARAYELEQDTVHSSRSETVETIEQTPILKFAVAAAAYGGTGGARERRIATQRTAAHDFLRLGVRAQP